MNYEFMTIYIVVLIIFDGHQWSETINDHCSSLIPYLNMFLYFVS